MIPPFRETYEDYIGETNLNLGSGKNLEKGFAWHYLRIKMLEYDLDPTGNANQCWDTGGIFDLDVFSCVCPPESTWTTNTRTDGGTDAGCYLIDPSAGSGSPTPKSLSSPTPNPIAALDPAKSFVMREQYASSARYSAKRILPPRCEPAAENVPPDDFCSWDATSCDWSCDETVHALPKESSR